MQNTFFLLLTLKRNLGNIAWDACALQNMLSLHSFYPSQHCSF